MSVHYNPPSVTDGLVLHLDATNPRSYPGTGTTWFDMSGNRNHGTLTNMSVPACHVRTYGGRAMEFDGFNDFIVSQNNWIGGQSALSLCVWFNLNNKATTPEGRVIASAPTADSGAVPPFNNFAITIEPDKKLAVAIGNNSTRVIVLSTMAVPSDGWVFVCGVYSGTAIILYINGTQNTSGSANLGAVGGNGKKIYIGHYNSELNTSIIANYNWPSQLDDIRIYNRALSPQEILQNFNATRGRFGV